ncbi:hypothetical protein Tco_0618765 [Tanacetum coccineum]
MSNSNTNLQTQTSSVLQNDTVSSCSISNIQEKTQLSRSRCMHNLKEIKSLFKFLSETLQDYGTMPIFKRTFSQDLDLLEQHLTKDILSRIDWQDYFDQTSEISFEKCFQSEVKAQRYGSSYNAILRCFCHEAFPPANWSKDIIAVFYSLPSGKNWRSEKSSKDPSMW